MQTFRPACEMSDVDDITDGGRSVVIMHGTTRYRSSTPRRLLLKNRKSKMRAFRVFLLCVTVAASLLTFGPPWLVSCLGVVGLGWILGTVWWVTTSDVSNLKKLPATWSIYLQVVYGALVKKRWLSEDVKRVISKEVRLGVPVTVQPHTLKAFKILTGMERQYDEIPLMYFIVEPFGLSMLHMARNIPVSLLGLVLARNESECFRAVKSDEQLTPSVSLREDIRRTDKGDVEFDIVMDATDSNGFVVWKSTTVVLVLNPKRLRGKKGPKEQNPKPIEGKLIDTWKLGGDTGRQYAALNGDINPIHLYPWTAKLFGFKKPIAHALFQVGKSIATLENKKGFDVIGHWHLRTEFKRPTMLPCTLKFFDQSSGCPEGTIKFCLGTEDGVKEVIVGTLVKK